MKCTNFQGITTKAAHHTCDYEKEKKKKKKKRSSLLYSIPDALDDLDVCRGDSGFFADPNAPCKTYMMSGRMPQLNKKKSSTVCVKASRMTDFFDVSYKFDDMSTTFLDTNITFVNDLGSSFIDFIKVSINKNTSKCLNNF